MINSNKNIKPFISENSIFSELNEDLKSTIINDETPQPEGKPKSITEELYKLFDPESFDCGCHVKLRKNINKFNNNQGYIPNEIKRNIKDNEIGNHLEGKGSNVLVNSFHIENSDGTFSKRIYAFNSPSAVNYNVLDYFVVLPDGYDNLYYSIDCNGYLTGVINSGVGINTASIKASSENAIKTNKSLVVIKGILHSPLFQSIKGEGIFLENKKLRKEVIGSIIHNIPVNYNDESLIVVNSNNNVLLTSNNGSSSFNGKAEISGSGGYSFLLGSVNSSVNAKGTIARLSSFSNFNTYILASNLDSFPIKIKIKDLKTIFNDL